MIKVFQEIEINRMLAEEILFVVNKKLLISFTAKSISGEIIQSIYLFTNILFLIFKNFYF